MQHWEQVNIGEFTGPLDLLVTMIKDKKISIMDINLIELADQYLNYINSQKALDIEIASEYLAMAAYLIELKSHLLLSRDNNEAQEDEYSYDDFLEQLTKYDQIKSVTDFFINKQHEYLATFSKPKSKTHFAVKQIYDQEEELMINPLNIDMEDFAQIFKKVMMQAEMTNFNEHIAFEDEPYNTVVIEALSPQDIASLILTKMKTNKIKEWKLEELLSTDIFSLKNLISTFLAILDLVRYSIAKVQQMENTLLVQFSKEALEDESMIDAVEVQNYE